MEAQLHAHAQQEQILKDRMEKQIANEVMNAKFEKTLLKENNFEELKDAIMPYATTIAMQLPLDIFRKTKKGMMKKTEHHQYTLAEVACVCNAFEQNGNDHNMGGEDNWDKFAVSASVLGKECKKMFTSITRDVQAKIMSGIIQKPGSPLMVGKGGEA